MAVGGSAFFRRSAAASAPPPVDYELDVPPIPGEVARPLTFGFASLLSDFTFLEAIQLAALRKASIRSELAAPLDRRLQNLLSYAVEVDPKFAGAYRFAGAALPHETLDGKALGVLSTVQILKRGARERPDDWHIPFYLGFLQVYYLRDLAAGAQSLAQAARVPGAPAYIPFLATRVAAHGGELDVATALAEEMLAQANEEQTRKAWQERVDALHMERDLRAIEAAAARYREERGAIPPSIRALVEARYLPGFPSEPHGGRYLLAPDGTARSTAAERLQIYGGTAHLEVH